MKNQKKKISFKARLSQDLKEMRILIKSVPTLVFTLFVTAVFLMNLTANKSIDLPFNWLALDCGLVVSWFVFLVMDMLTKHFGPKAATQISILATLLNLGVSALFFTVSIIPGNWSQSYVEGSEILINTALNNTFGGTWYIIMGSAVAFTLSAFVNNFINYAVGKAFKKNPGTVLAYFCSSCISTALGQFTDNFVFAFLVSRVFFGWTLTQCITCSLFGMLVELICESIFSIFGYRICERWKKNNVGKEYLHYINKNVRY